MPGIIFSKIISGGQTGVDRAALDVALELGIPCGGWCPKGRKAEDGPIDPKYPLKETKSTQYHFRTIANVMEADATLILTSGIPTGGTAFIIEVALKHKKPYLVIDLKRKPNPSVVRDWTLDSKEIVPLEELLMSNTYEQEALINLLEKKGIIIKAELLEEIKV